MTNGGPSLENWANQIDTRESRMKFMVLMMKQIIPGLEKIHSFGYTHSDIKLANICARASKHHPSSFIFTLIDFGVCGKQPLIGQKFSPNAFRGNLMFASIEHIVRKRATCLCDIYSLIYSAYFFVYDSLPWLDYVEEKALHLNNPDLLYEEYNFSQTRIYHNKAFENELIEKSGELCSLFKYVHQERKKYQKLH